MSGYAFPADAGVVYLGESYRFAYVARDDEGTHLFKKPNGCFLQLTREQVRRAVGAGDLLMDRPNKEDGRPRVGLATSAGCERDLREARRRLAWGELWAKRGRPSVAPASLKRFIRAVSMEADTRDLEVLLPLPSETTLYRFIKQSDGGSSTLEDVMPQTANRGSRKPKMKEVIADLIDWAINEEYLQRKRITVSELHEIICEHIREENRMSEREDHLPNPSRQTVARAVDALCPYERAMLREGRKAADEKWRQNAPGYLTTKVNQRWEIDHTILDVEGVSACRKHVIGRPTVTTVLDVHSRMVMAAVLSYEPPSTELAMAAMRQALLPKDQLFARLGISHNYVASGCCETLLSDNGREFHGASFRNALKAAGITLEYAPVGKAWYKGKVERFLGTLNREVAHRLPGTVRGSVAERDKDPDPEMRPRFTLAELERKMWSWVVGRYQGRHHRGLGMSPLDAWNASIRRSLQPAPLPPHEVNLFLSTHVARKVTKKGIEFRNFFYVSPDLREVRLRHNDQAEILVIPDPDDATQIRYCDPSLGSNWKIARIREDQRLLAEGFSWEEIRSVRAYRRNYPERFEGMEPKQIAEVTASLSGGRSGIQSKHQSQRKRAEAARDAQRRATEHKLARYTPAPAQQADDLDAALGGSDLPDEDLASTSQAEPSAGDQARPASDQDRFDPEAWAAAQYEGGEE